jgi:hypothetical protein
MDKSRDWGAWAHGAAGEAAQICTILKTLDLHTVMFEVYLNKAVKTDCMSIFWKPTSEKMAVWFCFFEIESHWVDQAGLEHTIFLT